MTHAGGRPSKYKELITPNMLKLISFWVLKGVKEEGIAERLGIAYSTFKEWKDKYEEFSAALKRDRGVVDDHVESSLYKKAMEGDTTACIFWLKNRRPKEWRDKQELEHSGVLNVANVSNLSEKELEAEIRKQKEILKKVDLIEKI
jgi:hypothetical protein